MVQESPKYLLNTYKTNIHWFMKVIFHASCKYCSCSKLSEPNCKHLNQFGFKTGCLDLLRSPCKFILAINGTTDEKKLLYIGFVCSFPEPLSGKLCEVKNVLSEPNWALLLIFIPNNGFLLLYDS